MNSNDLSQFSIATDITFFDSSYRVKWQTRRGDYYLCLFDLNEPVILNTLKSSGTKVKIKDIKLLKKTIKEKGIHYSVNNVKF